MVSLLTIQSPLETCSIVDRIKPLSVRLRKAVAVAGINNATLMHTLHARLHHERIASLRQRRLQLERHSFFARHDAPNIYEQKKTPLNKQQQQQEKPQRRDKDGPPTLNRFGLDTKHRVVSDLSAKRDEHHYVWEFFTDYYHLSPTYLSPMRRIQATLGRHMSDILATVKCCERMSDVFFYQRHHPLVGIESIIVDGGGGGSGGDGMDAPRLFRFRKPYTGIEFRVNDVGSALFVSDYGGAHESGVSCSDRFDNRTVKSGSKDHGLITKNGL